MRVLFPSAVLALLLAWSTAGFAQSPENCPGLPQGSDLSWQVIRNDSLLFCRAVRSDGSDAFALTFTRKPTFSPDRRKSANSSTFAGVPLQWYRSTLVGNPDMQVREALMPLDDGGNIQFVVRASNDAGLQRAFNEISSLRITAVAAR